MYVPTCLYLNLEATRALKLEFRVYFFTKTGYDEVVI